MVASSVLSPNVGNYYIGKGVCSIKMLATPGVVADGAFVDCGNVPLFEFIAKVTQLDHFSSRSGVKIKDFAAVTQLAGTLTMQLEEYTPRNIGLAVLGQPTMLGSPDVENITIPVFNAPIMQGAVQFVGTNDIGTMLTVTFPLVQFTPSKALSLIGVTWGQIDLSCDVLFDPVTQTFGTITASMQTSPSDIA